jgi:hypothetical protein
MNFVRILIGSLLTVTLMLTGCGGEKNKEYLPSATGKPGDIILIMDSIQWRGEVGSNLRQIFREEIKTLPREEMLFNLTWVYPRKGSTLLTQIRNLVFVFTLDKNTSGSRTLREQFSQETLDRIQRDSTFHMVVEQDEYARGQEVMYLFAATEAELIRFLKENKPLIQDHFNALERKRFTERLVATKSTKGVTDFLRQEQGCEINVPFGFKLADNQADFVWLRQMDAQVDKDIFITWKKYESEYQLLPDSLIAWRNDIASRYLFEDPAQPDSYLVTETSVPFRPVQARQVNFNNKFAMELRGLWKTNNNTMGGPFISYTVVDDAKGLLYYVEGFCFSPGKPQRETVRELESILRTFRTSQEIKASSPAPAEAK